MISQKATALCIYEILKTYSDENHVLTTDKIRERYPDSNRAKQNLCLRDVVCNQLNVKEKSNNIYNSIKNIFTNFGIISRRAER